MKASLRNGTAMRIVQPALQTQVKHDADVHACPHMHIPAQQWFTVVPAPVVSTESCYNSDLTQGSRLAESVHARAVKL